MSKNLVFWTFIKKNFFYYFHILWLVQKVSWFKVEMFFSLGVSNSGSVTNGTFPSCLLGVQAFGLWSLAFGLWSLVFSDTERKWECSHKCLDLLHPSLCPLHSETCLFPKYISVHYILDTGQQYHPSFYSIWKTRVSPSLENWRDTRFQIRWRQC